MITVRINLQTRDFQPFPSWVTLSEVRRPARMDCLMQEVYLNNYQHHIIVLIINASADLRDIMFQSDARHVPVAGPLQDYADLCYG
jgi:hypothetical protein